MREPKRYVATASTIEEALAAVAKFPGMLNQAFRRWKRVRMVIEEEPERRSLDQNALQWRWCSDAAQQGDMSAEDYQAFCKLHFGIPILRRDSERYCEAYDRILKPLLYEQKLELMKAPFEWPVTRGMTKKQLTEYLNRVYEHFTSLGFRLTDPGLQGIGPDQYREAA